ncbi:MAG: chemotaxis protein CheX [Desulfobacterota bacterium]|jgi:CheY-specific phosphatase CheX|nr:chemotaxis protein CheX [Thermodesulfobacteriota bacterium]
MDENLGRAAAQAVGHVFETMFFVFLEPGDSPAGEDRDGPREGAEAEMLGSLGFQGRLRGVLRLRIPYTLARGLATNFLGLETPASEAQAVDMVQELANMVCGNLFSIFDGQEVYRLGTPRAEVVRGAPDQEKAGTAETLRLDFLAEGRKIGLELTWEAAVAGPAG